MKWNAGSVKVHNRYATRASIVLLYNSLRVFHTCFNWWFLIGVWETASLLKSFGFLWVFQLILLGWAWISRCCPVHQNPNRGKNPKKHLSGKLIIAFTFRYSNDATEWDTKKILSQSAGAVEYTDRISAEG